MKLYIRKLLRENLLERITINNTNNLCVVSLDNDTMFILLDFKTGEAFGYISFSLTDGDVYGIYGAYAKNGYGPLLYELAMTKVYPKGITMSDDSSTSYDALSVWDKFYKRRDVLKKPIKRTVKTNKEEILDDALSGHSKQELEWILKLHYTQFIYTLGDDKLNNLIKRGEEFKVKNPNIDFDEIIYDLEE